VLSSETWIDRAAHQLSHPRLNILIRRIDLCLLFLGCRYLHHLAHAWRSISFQPRQECGLWKGRRVEWITEYWKHGKFWQSEWNDFSSTFIDWSFWLWPDFQIHSNPNINKFRFVFFYSALWIRSSNVYPTQNPSLNISYGKATHLTSTRQHRAWRGRFSEVNFVPNIPVSTLMNSRLIPISEYLCFS